MPGAAARADDAGRPRRGGAPRRCRDRWPATCAGPASRSACSSIPASTRLPRRRTAGADAIEINTGAYADGCAAPIGRRVWRSSRRRRALPPRPGSRCWPATASPTSTCARSRRMPEIVELNIGHSIVARAALVGMERAVREMVALLDMNRLRCGSCVGGGAPRPGRGRPGASCSRCSAAADARALTDGVSIAAELRLPSARPAPAVILVHMLTRTHEDWARTAERLSEAGLVAVAIDLRGTRDVRRRDRPGGGRRRHECERARHRGSARVPHQSPRPVLGRASALPARRLARTWRSSRRRRIRSIAIDRAAVARHGVPESAPRGGHEEVRRAPRAASSPAPKTRTPTDQPAPCRPWARASATSACSTAPDTARSCWRGGPIWSSVLVDWFRRTLI